MEWRRFFSVTACFLHISLALAQTGELDEDATTVDALVEAEETVDRLRADPLDLRQASLSELLEIPGITRREALLIIQAIRSGRVGHLDQLKLIPGVSPRTVAMILPYVRLSISVRKNVSAGMIRYIGGVSRDEGVWRIGRSRYHMFLSSSIPGASTPSGFLNARWTGEHDASPRIHASTSLMHDRLEVHVGHLSVDPGTPFTEQGRRPGLFRPSDWRRLNSTIARVRLGTDDATTRQGATFSWHAADRRWLMGLLVDQYGNRNGVFSWSEALRPELRLNISWRSNARVVGLGVSYESQSTGGRIEILRTPRGPVSGFAFGRWSSEEGKDILIYLRHLRSDHVRGLPRQGSNDEDEDGGSISIATRPSRRWRWQLTGDVGRLRSLIGVNIGRWTHAGGASVMSELSLSDRDRVSAEVGRSLRRTDLANRITVRWTQTLTRSLEWSMTYSSRTETLPDATRRSAQLARCEVQARSEEASVTVRWLRVHGDPGIEFWNVGPGPTALGSIRPVSGRTSLVQAFAQGVVVDQLLAAFIVTYGWTGGDVPVGGGMSSSILLEFRL